MRRTRMSFHGLRARPCAPPCTRLGAARAEHVLLVAGCLFISTAAAAAGGSAGLLLNEVLYDPEGADAGLEFVELLLVAAEPLDLGRVVIERGNGSRPGDWRAAWHGAPGESLAPRVHYVVGGPGVVPAPDALMDLVLQNGPDACRVLVDGVVTDVLGWGELSAAEFFRGSPAPDVPAGTSLGRVPDGGDSGRNADDFRALARPSPGAANRPPSPFRLRSAGHRSDAGFEPRLEIEWTVQADEEFAAATVDVSIFPCSLVAQSAVTRAVLEDGAARGTLVLGPLVPGPVDLCLTCALQSPPALGDPPAPDTVLVAARAGPGPLRVNEFLFRPPAAEPEWVEVVNSGPDTLDASRFALADSRGEPVLLTGAPPLAPGALLVIAEGDLTALPAHVLGSRWPLLNDTGTPIADRVRVVEESGRTSDDVAYAGDWAPAGVSVERLSPDIPSADRAAWTAAPRGATPGRRNGVERKLTAGSGFLQIDPPIVQAGSAASILLQFGVPLRQGVLTIHASDGRLVRRFVGDALSGRRLIAWDGRDDRGTALPPGLYLVTLAAEEARSPVPPGPTGAPAGARSSRVMRTTLVVAP